MNTCWLDRGTESKLGTYMVHILGYTGVYLCVYMSACVSNQIVTKWYTQMWSPVGLSWCWGIDGGTISM